MKLGLSTYSLVRAINSGKMTVLDAIDWVAANGGEHVEIVPMGFELVGNESLIDAIRDKTQQVGIDISNYAIHADFIKDDEREYEQEIMRVMGEVDIAHRLGVKLMRHDVGPFTIPAEENAVIRYKGDLPRLVVACRRITDYAAQYGITTTVENHGYYINGSERIQLLVYEVNRTNFKATLDVGNFWCVDEEPVVAIKKCMHQAAMIHLKDFYFRTPKCFPIEGDTFKCESGPWFRTDAGNLLRGAIVGDGDIDMWEVLKVIKDSGYDGYISIEFEGIEDCLVASRMGMDNAAFLWKNI